MAQICLWQHIINCKSLSNFTAKNGAMLSSALITIILVIERLEEKYVSKSEQNYSEKQRLNFCIAKWIVVL